MRTHTHAHVRAQMPSGWFISDINAAFQRLSWRAESVRNRVRRLAPVLGRPILWSHLC